MHQKQNKTLIPPPIMLHVKIIMMHVDINKLHVMTIRMLTKFISEVCHHVVKKNYFSSFNIATCKDIYLKVRPIHSVVKRVSSLWPIFIGHLKV